MRDPDVRRIPLDLKGPGMYIVEAVSAPHRAYTIVIVSDVGLVSKAAPGQVLLYAADRRTGDTRGGLRRPRDRRPAADGAAATTGADGVFTAMLDSDDRRRRRVGGPMRRAGDGQRPRRWYLRESPRELVGYVFTDKPIYRPGHTVHLKAVLRWRTRGALMPFDRRRRRGARLGCHRQGDLPAAPQGRRLRRRLRRRAAAAPASRWATTPSPSCTARTPPAARSRCRSTASRSSRSA